MTDALTTHGSDRRGPLARVSPSVLIVAGMALTAVLATISLFIGVAELDAFVLFASRVPRTVALILAGAAFAVTGLIMQLLVRNRFVEPSTTGAADAGSLALLGVLMTTPGMPIWGKAIAASLDSSDSITELGHPLLDPIDVWLRDPVGPSVLGGGR